MCCQKQAHEAITEASASALVINATSQPIVVYWLNYEGKRDPNDDQKSRSNQASRERRERVSHQTCSAKVG
jgi:hypothetical protein